MVQAGIFKKERDMGEACSVHGIDETCRKGFGWKT